MPELKVNGSVPVPVEAAWAAVTDLGRYDDWLVLHDGWRSELPGELREGQRIASVIKTRGIRNRIAWTIEDLQPPRHVSLVGDGVGGAKVSMTFDLSGDAQATTVAMVVDFRHPMLKGPMGAMASRAIKGDLEASMRRLVEITR